jgi:NMD protein affecting ribosome stability and mRNA decay
MWKKREQSDRWNVSRLFCPQDKNSIISKEINIQVCKDCGARKRKNSWIRDDQNMIRNNIIENMVLKKGKLVDLTFEKVKGDRYKTRYRVNFLLEHRGIKFEKEKQVEIRIKYLLCDECSRKRSGYYEAIVQIRGNIPERWEEEIREARVGKVKTGFDLYFSSLSDAREQQKNWLKNMVQSTKNQRNSIRLRMEKEYINLPSF